MTEFQVFKGFSKIYETMKEKHQISDSPYKTEKKEAGKILSEKAWFY